ncbi:MAG: hypothetical protein JW801_13325 [Bacteroidales bacterium]|nr:hypothetical protein [Bacteroidales bacterium]
MKISGFSMGRNVGKLYYPFKESVESILPLVDEFVYALGNSDEDDRTREELLSIRSDKIRIIDTVWDLEKYPRGMEHAHQTDIAMQHCSGDWLFYLQADEVIHEKFLPVIEARCREFLHDEEVEAFLFNYVHFWADYEHHVDAHGWYKNEIRIVRNRPEIHSWISAQSFRRIPDFDGVSYRQKKGTYKLKVARIDADVYHYGWVRPPAYMKKKTRAININHRGEATVNAQEEDMQKKQIEFSYGPLKKIPSFRGTHPKVMEEKIKQFNWGDELNYTAKREPNTVMHKHEHLKYRIVTLFERLLRRPLFETNNYKLIRK